MSTFSKITGLSGKKRNIVAESAIDALKQRYPEVNSDMLDNLPDLPTQAYTFIAVS